MTATLQQVKKMLDSTASDLLDFPHDLPSACRHILAEARIASEDAGLRQAAAAFLRDPSGQRLLPELETLNQLHRGFQSAREDVFPSRTRYFGTNGSPGPLSAAPIWNQRGYLEDVLYDSAPVCLHPLAQPLEKFATSAFDSALGEAINQDVDPNAFQLFAESARSISGQVNELSEEMSRQLIDKARRVMRMDFLAQLDVATDQNVVHAASIIDCLQQRAKTLLDGSDMRTSQALDEVRSRRKGLDPKNWAAGMVSLRSTLQEISKSQAEPLSRLADTQRDVRAYAEGLHQRVEEARTATSKAFESATKQLGSATSVAESAYHEGQHLLAQAQQAGEFVRAFGEGRVSTSDLIGMLNLPAVPNLPELESLKEPLRAVQLLQDVAKDQLSDLFHGSESLLAEGASKISKQLGIDPSVVAAAQAITSVAQAVAGGNVFAAVGILAGGSNLFGGGSSDAAVMSQLAAINARLDQVLDNQKKMMKALDDIEKKLDILRDIVVRGFETTMIVLGTIENELVTIQHLVEEEADFDLNHCLLYVGEPDGNKVWKPGFFGRSTYADQKAFFEGENFGQDPSFGLCLRGIDGIFKHGPKAPSAKFLMSLDVKSGHQLDEMKKYLFNLDPVFQEYNQHLPDDETQRIKQVSRLLMPALTVDELMRKSSQDMEIVENDVLLESAKLAANSLNSETLLRVDRVVSAADRIMVAALIYPFLDSENPLKLVGPEKLLDASRFSETWKTRQPRVQGWLEDALILLNIAIAQQTVLSNEWLNGAVDRFNQDPTQAINTAILQDPLVLRNFMMLLIRGRLFGKGGVARNATVLQYSFALRQDDPSFIINLLGQLHPKLILYRGSEAAEWFLCEDKRRDSMLPSPAALDVGLLEIPPGLSQLARKREQIIKLCAETQLKEIVDQPAKMALASTAIIASVLKMPTLPNPKS
jgi:hypothetical protein